MRVLAPSSIVFALAFPLCILGCSTASPAGPADSGGQPAACVPYAAPAVSDLQTPTVSFVKDVLPIFQHSCVFSGCHQSMAAGLEFLGDNFDLETDGGYIGPAQYDAATYPASYAKRVYDGIVDAATVEAPSWVFIKPGDPANSFTMHKIDNDLCGLEAQCLANNTLFITNKGPQGLTSPCGGFMPEGQVLDDGGPALIDTDKGSTRGPRDTIRRWIAQGARNN